MKNIGVSMRDEILEEKKTKGKDGWYCYWTIPIPYGVGSGSLLWVANHGKWVGHFTIFRISVNQDEVHFHSESWIDDIQGERTPFRGFTYKVPSPHGVSP